MLVATAADAQTLLMSNNVKRDTTSPDRGPNRKHFSQWFLTEGFIIGQPESEGAEVIQGRSTQIEFGYRYKRRVNQTLAWGYEIWFNRRNYLLKQDSSKTFPDNILHKKEKFQLNTFRGGLYTRINLNRYRGEFLGTYLDIGGYGEWAFSTRHVTVDKNDVATTVGGSRTKSVNQNLVYMESFNYGIRARLGQNKVALFGDYRLSDMFDTGAANLAPEMPRLTVGFEIQLF